MKTRAKKFILSLTIFAVMASIAAVALFGTLFGGSDINKGNNAFAVSETAVSEPQTYDNFTFKNNFPVNASSDRPRFGRVSFDVDFSEEVRLTVSIEVFGDNAALNNVYAETKVDGISGEDVKFSLTDGSLTGSGGAEQQSIRHRSFGVRQGGDRRILQ